MHFHLSVSSLATLFNGGGCAWRSLHCARQGIPKDAFSELPQVNSLCGYECFALLGMQMWYKTEGQGIGFSFLDIGITILLVLNCCETHLNFFNLFPSCETFPLVTGLQGQNF